MHDHRLAPARDFGATHTINSKTKNLVQEVAKITGYPVPGPAAPWHDPIDGVFVEAPRTDA